MSFGGLNSCPQKDSNFLIEQYVEFLPFSSVEKKRGFCGFVNRILQILDQQINPVGD